jgi:hypothetical protein
MPIRSFLPQDELKPLFPEDYQATDKNHVPRSQKRQVFFQDPCHHDRLLIPQDPPQDDRFFRVSATLL